MAGVLLIIGAAGVAVTVLGGMYYVKQDNKRWQREFAREALFLKIKAYREEIGG